MSKIQSLANGALISIFIFLLYTLDSSISSLALQTNSVKHLSEEIKMARNYKEYNKVKSNNYITSFCNIDSILKNPMQFILFFVYKNDTLGFISKEEEKQIMSFISKCAKEENYKDLKNLEIKVVSLFKDGSKIADMACEMLITIIRRLNIDAVLYPNKIHNLVKEWCVINKFILKQHSFNNKDAKTLIDFIMIYKLTEVCYL